MAGRLLRRRQTLAYRMPPFAALAEGLALREVSQHLAGYLGRRAAEGGQEVQGGRKSCSRSQTRKLPPRLGPSVS